MKDLPSFICIDDFKETDFIKWYLCEFEVMFLRKFHAKDLFLLIFNEMKYTPINRHRVLSHLIHSNFNERVLFLRLLK